MFFLLQGFGLLTHGVVRSRRVLWASFRALVGRPAGVWPARAPGFALPHWQLGGRHRWGGRRVRRGGFGWSSAPPSSGDGEQGNSALSEARRGGVTGCWRALVCPSAACFRVLAGRARVVRRGLESGEGGVARGAGSGCAGVCWLAGRAPAELWLLARLVRGTRRSVSLLSNQDVVPPLVAAARPGRPSVSCLPPFS